MKKVPPFYPILFGAFPILSVYSNNQSFVPLAQLWRPLGVGLAVSLALWLLCSGIAKSLERGAVAASVVVASVYSYQTVIGATPFVPDSLVIVLFWTAATMALAWLAAKKLSWHGPLLFFSLVLVALPTLKIALGAVQAPRSRAVQNPGGGQSKVADKPDIIYVVLDGYGRSDVLQEKYGFSDQSFIDGLEKRGFYVAKEARANYCQTELSIGSALNADYLQKIVEGRPELTDNERFGLRRILAENRVFARLRQEGYLVSKIETGFPATEEIKADREISRLEGLSLLESTILQMTPVGQRSETVGPLFEQRSGWLLRAFDDLGSLGGRSNRPRFTFVHILAPHPPFNFGPNGEPKKRETLFGYWDASDYMAAGGTVESYTKGYSDQAIFVGKKVLEAVDRILAAGGPKPIVIIHGDHGPKRGLDQSSFEKTDSQECFPILYALLGPEEIKSKLYPTISPVNTFRTILREVFGDDLPNLDDRSWYSPYGRPFEFTDVTNVLR